MTIDGARYDKRNDAGKRLQQVLQREAASLTGGQRRTGTRAGHLGGFDVTAMSDRVLGTIQVVVALDGAPGTELRMTAEDVAGADPAGLVIRLENRLSGLESLKTRTLDEIDRLRTEAARASDDLGKPFAQASQLAAARDRVRDIGEQLEEAARPPRPAEGQTTDDTNRSPAFDVVANTDGKIAAETSAPAAQVSAGAVGYRQREPVSLTQRSFPCRSPIADPTAHSATAGPVPAAQSSPAQVRSAR
jgi:hypothetical protein